MPKLTLSQLERHLFAAADILRGKAVEEHQRGQKDRPCSLRQQEELHPDASAGFVLL